MNIQYRGVNRFVVRFKGSEGVLEDFGKLEDAREYIKAIIEEDKEDRLLFFYEIYDNKLQQIVN